jgi:hypothetical protein
MNFVSVIFAVNLCLSSAIPFAKLPNKKITASGCTTGACDFQPIVGQGKRTTNSSNSVLMQFRNNPAAFISAMSKADPNTLREVLSLLNQLLTTSQEREDELIDFLNQKIAELGSADDAVASAQGVLDDAVAAQAVAEHNLRTSQANVASAEADLANKVDVQNNKQTEKNDAQANHDASIDTLNDEQAVLTQVIEILTDLLGRQPVHHDQDLFLDHNGVKYYKVQVTGAMSSANILTTCVDVGLTPLCSGQSDCNYNDANCKETELTQFANSCGWPMHGLAKVMCNTDYPRDCPNGEFEGLYNYMHSWNNHAGCGVEGSSWCADGHNANDRWALCVN